MRHRLPTWWSLVMVVSLLVSAGGVNAPAPARAAPSSPQAPAAVTRVAYVHGADAVRRDSFNAFLAGRGITVDLVPLASAATFNYSADQVIIIGPDTGSLSTWGTPAVVTQINNAGKPVVGVGEGGYAFLGRASMDIGHPRGAHGSGNAIVAPNPNHSLFNTPHVINIARVTSQVAVYTNTVGTVEIHLPGAPLARPLGQHPTEASYARISRQGVQDRCYSLWGFEGAPSAMTPDGQNLFINLLNLAPCLALNAAFAVTPPILNGAVGFGEWPASSQGLSFPNGYIVVRNDGLRLYVLVNVLGDTADGPPGSQTADYFWLTFDTDRDGVIDANLDLNFGQLANGNMRPQHYLGPSSWTGTFATTRSALGRGFGCSFADGSLAFISFSPLRFNCSSHRVWEFGIDLREIGAQAGGVVRMGLRAASGAPAFVNNLPPNFFNDFSDLIDVKLAAPPVALPSPNPGATLAFEANPIEITQAIQDRPNTLPLVANKETVARVYVESNGIAGSEPAIVYLYGSRGGVDLPGSPMVQLIQAPPTINRANQNHTANFLLPPSWDNPGATNFQAGRARLTDGVTLSAAVNPSFQTQRAPIFWIIRTNTGSNASPIQASQAEVASQQSYMKTVFPVAQISWVEKTWQSLGVVSSLDDAMAKLKNYHASAVLAWILTVVFTGKQPYNLPDGIYGFLTSGGGTSDPTWWESGGGYVAAGFRGTSREGTMAHEINHILDRGAAPGTWGRHVGGCGADGPQPSWPYANTQIQQVGFDTRLPWSTSSAVNTVIPNTVPDFMSYCQSANLPTKWISPYRWQNLFSFFNPASLNLSAIQGVIEDVYYVSGQLHQAGGGSLDPVLQQPGLASTGVTPGAYSIEVQNAGGAALYTLPFHAEFVDPEGEPKPTSHFSFQIPAQEGAARIVLKAGTQVLAERGASANAPSVTLTSPNGGETWSGVQNVTWSASDADGDALTFTLLYSPDDLASWFPVAWNVTGSTYALDTSHLPGSSQARIRIIASDGFHNSQDDSDAVFTLADAPPQVTILAPMFYAFYPSGAGIAFEGHASDANDENIPDTNFVWSYQRLEAGAWGAPVLFGMGPLEGATLADGIYRATLTVVDSNGGAGEDSVEFAVQAARLFLPLVARD